MFSFNQLFGRTDWNVELFRAVKNNDLTKARISIENEADANVTNPDHITPLMVSTYNNNIEMAILLLDNGANVNAKDSNGITPLMMSALSGNLDLAELFLARGAMIEAKAVDGRTALMYATATDHANVFSLLLRKGANVNAKASDDGGTPLMAAAWTGNAFITSCLLNAGADPNAKMLNGKTASVIATERGHSSLLKLITAPSLKDLLGPDSNAEDASIGIAALNHFVEVVKDLDRTSRDSASIDLASVRRDSGAVNPRQYLAIPEGAVVGVAALNHFVDSVNGFVRQIHNHLRYERAFAGWTNAQIVQHFIRMPEEVGGLEMFANGVTPQSLIADAVRQHNVNPAVRIPDLGDAILRGRAADITIKLYSSWDTNMSEAALKVRRDWKSNINMLEENNNFLVQLSKSNNPNPNECDNRIVALKARNNELMHAMDHNKMFVDFFEDMFKPGIKQAMMDLEKIAALSL